MKHLIYISIFSLLSILSSAAQTPAELKSWLPAIDGWSISEKMEVFSPDNLFDRINGSAPLYIENNFREMMATEYTKEDEYITIQAYRHATPEDAFGMYASERSPDLRFFPFGGEAQGDGQDIFFFAGSMYVKIWTSAENAEDALKAIAGGFAEKIEPDAKYPPVVQAFPSDGKISHSETYITSNYIGHEFLRGVYTARYEIDGQSYQAFVIDAKTPDEANRVLRKYFAFTEQADDPQEGMLLIKDRYNGDIPVFWKGRYIMGIFSENGKTADNAESLLSEISKNLDKI
jgi:hypothetical protein